MKKILFNPFIKIAGFQALGIGLLLMLAGALLAGFCHARFDGVLDLHFFIEQDFTKPFTDQLLVWLSLVVIFYTIALISGSKPRLVDIAGTFALARAPYSLAPLVNINGTLSTLTQRLTSSMGNGNEWPLSSGETLGLIIPLLLSILLAIWMVVLYFNAYKTSTNLKGTRLVTGFIACLLLSEILSVYLIRVLFNY